MSQEKLGDAIGLTFQQVQKYERGSNRISAGTLYRLSQVLDVPVSFFFDCYDDPHTTTIASRGESVASGGEISRREARLLRLWRSAPGHIADEMLSLLSALSPDVREAREGGEGGEDGDELIPTFPARITDRGEPGTKPASSRSAKRGTKAAGNRPRRRHGAVWDPADIYRASKNPAVSE